MEDDELAEEYLTGLTRLIRDYIINGAITKEEIHDIVSKPPTEFIDFVAHYEGVNNHDRNN